MYDDGCRDCLECFVSDVITLEGDAQTIDLLPKPK